MTFPIIHLDITFYMPPFSFFLSVSFSNKKPSRSTGPSCKFCALRRSMILFCWGQAAQHYVLVYSVHLASFLQPQPSQFVVAHLWATLSCYCLTSYISCPPDPQYLPTGLRSQWPLQPTLNKGKHTQQHTPADGISGLYMSDNIESFTDS